MKKLRHKMDLFLLACNKCHGFFISKFVTDSFPPLMACHRFFMNVNGFFMKALPLVTAIIFLKDRVFAPVTAAQIAWLP